MKNLFKIMLGLAIVLPTAQKVMASEKKEQEPINVDKQFETDGFHGLKADTTNKLKRVIKDPELQRMITGMSGEEYDFNVEEKHSSARWLRKENLGPISRESRDLQRSVGSRARPVDLYLESSGIERRMRKLVELLDRQPAVNVNDSKLYQARLETLIYWIGDAKSAMDESCDYQLDENGRTTRRPKRTPSGEIVKGYERAQNYMANEYRIISQINSLAGEIDARYRSPNGVVPQRGNK